jgi:hypothetical protein
MARYLVQATHTPEECLSGLDEALAQGEATLARFDFACAVGDHSNHICFTTLEAPDMTAARSMLPGGIAGKAQVVEVGKFTPQQVRSFHGQ